MAPSPPPFKIRFPALPDALQQPMAEPTLRYREVHVELQRVLVIGCSAYTERVLQWLCAGIIEDSDEPAPVMLSFPDGGGASGGNGAQGAPRRRGSRPPPGGWPRFAFAIGGEVVLTPEEGVFLFGEALPRGLVPPLEEGVPCLAGRDVFQAMCEQEPRFAERYHAYRYFRLGLGYVVRAGAGFGADFMLYKGSPDTVHASYGAWVLRRAGLDEEWGGGGADAMAVEGAAAVDGGGDGDAAAKLADDAIVEAWREGLDEAEAEDARRRARPEEGALSWLQLQQACRVMTSVKKALVVCWPEDDLQEVVARRGSGGAYAAMLRMRLQSVLLNGVSVTGKHGGEDGEEETGQDAKGDGAEGGGRSETATAMQFSADEDRL